jgi:hypothetical protein
LRWGTGSAQELVRLAITICSLSIHIQVRRRGTLLLNAGMAVLGFARALVLPEPAGRSLEDMPASTREACAQPLRVADRASAT